MSTLTLKNLNKQYNNGFNAVKDVNISINQKEFLVLVGPSGCGKSTTLRMIAGLEHPSSGEINIDEKIVNEIEPKDRDIAMVFQNYALYPHMSVFDNLAFSLKMKKFKKDEIKQMVETTAKKLELDSLLTRKPGQLSGGQRQRVALGRAIIRKPKLYLMDEPLSNLDAKLRVQMRSEIIKLYNDSDASVVYVTHDQTEAMTMGTKIVVMNKGEIQQIADPYNIYNSPSNVFVASFIGSPQMNFLTGEVIENENKIFIKCSDILIKLTNEKSKALKEKEYINKKIKIGIRPEDLHYKDNFSSLDSSEINVKVELSEMLGHETYVYSKFNSINIISRVEPDVILSNGESISLTINPDKIHIFDIDTEENILL